MADQQPLSQPEQPALQVPVSSASIISPNSATVTLDHNNLDITAASLRGSPSDRIIKPRPRKDSLQSISGSDSVPGRVQKPRARKSPGSGAKRSEPSKRKFICSFSHYGCDVALSSKNEWKRHVSIQHLQLGFYRCDVGSCNPDANPNVPGSKKVYNDFNRKDLFTQHHRRMHKPESGPGSGTSPTASTGGENNKDWRAFEDSLEDVRSRCWHERRKPPQRSTCGFCGRVFEGEGSWNERMEHVGGHFSRDIPEACKEEREDEDLTHWALQENIVKELGNGRHVLVDQPPTAGERPYVSRDRDISMTDAPPVTPTQANGNGSQHDDDSAIDRSLSASYQNGQGLRAPLSPDSRRGYNVAPPPLRPYAFGEKEESNDRLEELVNTLLQPKRAKQMRRFTWKCVCNFLFHLMPLTINRIAILRCQLILKRTMKIQSTTSENLASFARIPVQHTSRMLTKVVIT